MTDRSEPAEGHAGDLAAPTCTGGDTCRCVATPVFELLGRKYAMDAVCVVAAHGPVRFGTVADHLPDASTSTVSSRLDELREAGILERERYDEIPPRVEYALTEDGEAVRTRLEPLLEWATANG